MMKLTKNVAKTKTGLAAACLAAFFVAGGADAIPITYPIDEAPTRLRQQSDPLLDEAYVQVDTSLDQEEPLPGDGSTTSSGEDAGATGGGEAGGDTGTVGTDGTDPTAGTTGEEADGATASGSAGTNDGESAGPQTAGESTVEESGDDFGQTDEFVPDLQLMTFDLTEDPVTQAEVTREAVGTVDVPEPATLALLGLGLAGLGAVGRRRGKGMG